MNKSAKDEQRVPRTGGRLPPTPPDSEDSLSTSSSSSQEDNSASFPLPPPCPPTQFLEIDRNTPDKHVPRDHRLIRLTGTHPYNVEAPLSDLFNEGFLTSPELFYVRNHGAVPEVHDDDIPNWEFSVEGMVEKPFRLALRDLVSQYEQKTYPITLVCAGNRRKEQNVVRKTKGFSWGAAGVSTALFTGVTMADVIRKAKPKKGAKFVCMEGADKLPNGYYGTSVKINWVMDPNKGMMLAYKMNGEMLRPDHGKPLRAVIPGQIGGRSVKWLKKLIVTAEPSDNWYHIYDNRVLPTTVSPEEAANNPNWWTDERYAIYDLSCNSAIAYPAHEEQLCLVGAPEKYRAKGYAYSGGGRRVTRVELSIDRGRSWRLANCRYPEDAYRDIDEDIEIYGSQLDTSWREASFCWCFWELDIPVADLADAKDMLVRCMDESMQAQPRDMYWSVLGMMNNPWFRVTINREGDYLRFEHPTQPALMPGGWMERVKKSGGNLLNGYWGERIGDEDTDVPPEEQAKEVPMKKEGIDRMITIDELRKHDGEQHPWFVVNGEVYDATDFMKDHPGGAQSIVSSAGVDASDEFMAIHSETAKAMMPDYHIGALDDHAKIVLGEGAVQDNNDRTEQRPSFLSTRSWVKAVLESKESVSWDTRIFKFRLEHDDQVLGLPTGMHLMMRLRDPVTRETIIRSYTPISHETQKGYLDVLVKIYFDQKQRKGGKMSQALEGLPIGHFVDFKGPIGKFEYHGHGICSVNGIKRKVDSLIFISGGTGITPIYQVMRAVMEDKKDPTKCVALNGNRLMEDILCKDQLNKFSLENANRCRIIHTLTQAPDGWSGLKGRIAAPVLKQHCARSEQSMALICGPEAMEKAVHVALKEQGWKDDDLLFF
ncbi:MAG: hypothetical protein M1828_000565 [Chrysothrix sp. TS-e1954]|nr:MAG: hypothetical protein M1828_000565 [Chrysothrix sp. TS-e1954]